MEKEMLHLRKLLFATVLLALLSTAASAQVLSCVAQAAGTPLIRTEGLTELVGDIIIRCTGGTPTPVGQPVPQVNIQIFSQGLNITSRILQSSNSFTEALLFIDEPTPDNQTLCGSDAAPAALPGICTGNTGVGNGIGTYSGDDDRPNAWQGRRAVAPFTNTSLVWPGIQFDPPGTQTDRVIRITNVRVSAAGLGNPVIPTAVKFFISTSASGIGEPGGVIPPPIQLPITNPEPTVAFAQKSLDFTAGSTTGLQCFSDTRDVTATFTELFPSAWRRRSLPNPIGLSMTAMVPSAADPLRLVPTAS
jgi:hypothetical protein